MNLKKINKLIVNRRLSTGKTVQVGTLAQNKNGIYFQYFSKYLDLYKNLSPFKLNFTQNIQLGPKIPHQGLHGVFADSLPDGWGIYLQDKLFQQNNILRHNITPLDRLAFVGKSGLGALFYTPISQSHDIISQEFSVETLGIEAKAIFEESTSAILTTLARIGNSGGARPKAQIYTSDSTLKTCHIFPQDSDAAWIVKFTSSILPLGDAEGVCEAIYLALAKQAKLEPVQAKLLKLSVGKKTQRWLATKRFDWLKKDARLHVLSVCGALDADFRVPSLDYLDLIKVSTLLCKSPDAGKLQFSRAIFNLFSCNQDDHTKNWAFIQEDSGIWKVAPWYDITFSPHPYNEHAMSFCGYGRKPPLDVIRHLAEHAGFNNWQGAQFRIKEIVDIIASFSQIAEEYSLDKETTYRITQTLEECRTENIALLK